MGYERLVTTHEYTDFAAARRQACLSSSPGSEETSRYGCSSSTIAPRAGCRIRRQAATHDDTSSDPREACSLRMLAKITAAALRFLESAPRAAYRAAEGAAWLDR